MAATASAYCTGCGRSIAECSGCQRAFDPPRFCPACGRRMTVRVTPTSSTARCRDHGVTSSEVSGAKYPVYGTERAQNELGALRTPDGWLMASATGERFASLFGRDALISALQVLPIAPDIADATLTALGSHLGSRFDHEREEEPGKVPHEVRTADLDAYVEHGWPVRDGRLAYYGSVDASSWWLIVFAAFARAGHDVNAHLPAARRVATWLAENADPLVYRRRATSGGLAHHWWRDVAADLLGTNQHGMFRDDGSPMTGGVGVAAAQALAWRALSDAAETLDRSYAGAAANARRAFGHHYVADGRVVIARDDAGPAHLPSSDLGIVLWTGILSEELTARVTDIVASTSFVTPFGVRTLPTTHPAFRETGYHAGAVWPFDNWFASATLSELSHDVLRAIEHLGFVELYGVSEAGALLPNEEACRVQAWTVGAVIAWAQRWDGRTWV